jgi:hypothetical protein
MGNVVLVARIDDEMVCIPPVYLMSKMQVDNICIEQDGIQAKNMSSISLMGTKRGTTSYVPAEALEQTGRRSFSSEMTEKGEGLKRA